MKECRLAKEEETNPQKLLWRHCFGDSESYIDFHFAHRNKKDKTVILLDDEEIAAMLTMIPVKTVTPKKLSIDTVMFYAIATHPDYQNKGYATRLMDFSNQYLRENDRHLSVLVPASKKLFGFYNKQGYSDGFYIRETQLTRTAINNLPICKSSKFTISAISPKEYNQRRNNQLEGRLYVAYADEDIAYQKKLSQLSGADIYGIESLEVQGCVVIERVNLDKVLIKEILLPAQAINGAIKEISNQLYALEYILRMPAYLGEHLEGSIRPFGMIRGHREIELEITPESLGYLGLAFD